MSFQNLDLKEEEPEPDYSPEYPFGGLVEPYDLERDEEDNQ